MSDIDFAELDKAVNNLVNKNNLPAPTSNLEASPPEKEDVRTTTGDQTVQKPKGRFMDVFHPSSDMTGNESAPLEKPAPPTPAPRKVVSPIYNDMVLPATKKTPSVLPISTTEDNTSLSKSDWPDPIEAAATAKTESIPSSEEEPAKTKITPESLFLPDTKVEKRPLGGFSGENVPDLPDDDKKKKNLPQAAQTEENAASDNAASTNLPPELEADLVAIEEGSGDDKAENFDELDNDEEPSFEKPKLDLIEEDDTEPAPFLQYEDAKDEPEPSKKSSVAVHDEEVPSETYRSKSELSGLLAAGSIPQQYKTSAVPSESADGAHPMFFDADQYNKAPSPGAHAARKTTLFQWIFITVGLLLLGATLGAALFVFVSGQ